jgi:hypothetical protein
MSNRLVHRIETVADYMKAFDIVDHGDLAEHLDEIKTVGYYRRALRRAVLDFYRGDIDAFAFIDEMIRLIEGQFTRAFNEGMRKMGLDPTTDMTPEWRTALNQKVFAEHNNILDFAQAIEDARNNNGDPPLEHFYSRVELWVNRFNEIMNWAMQLTGGRQKLEWQLGRTERHCTTCFALNGIVDYADSWTASGYQPQNAPNPMLECGGWRCDCRLVPTNKRRTRGGVPKI